MTFKLIKGDLFDPSLKFDGFAQGVNCQGIMGAGIAVPFKTMWPEMYEDYKAMCTKWRYYLPGLLHTYPTYDETYGQITIYNLFSQDLPGRNGDYGLLQRAAFLMLLDAEERGLRRVGLPWIGCGIAGLEKHNVYQIFALIFAESKTEFILVEQ